MRWRRCFLIRIKTPKGHCTICFCIPMNAVKALPVQTGRALPYRSVFRSILNRNVEMS